MALGEAGSHFIKIYSAQSYEHTDATYELGVSLSEGLEGVEVEPNSDGHPANPLPLGSSIRGNLFNANDVDWFVFSTDVAGELTVNFTVPTQSYDDWDLGVYQDDRSNGGNFNLVHTKSLSKTGSFSVALGEPGTHFVKVYTGSSYSHADDTYELSMSLR